MFASQPLTARRVAALLLLLAAIAATPRCGPVTPAAPPPRRLLDPAWTTVAETVGAALEAEIERHELPAVSIALVAGDRMVWGEAFGSAELGAAAASRPADIDTVFRVGSVSKLFTDIAVMQLVEAGDIDLDAPLTDYLPEVTPANPYDTPITLRQLMSHRSGLVREPPVGHYFDDTAPSLEATVSSLAATRLVYPPGTHTKYSNAGVATVGLVLERLTGEPFAQALRRRLLQPLGMDASSFEPTPALRAHLAEALMWGIDGREFPAPTFELGMAPAGSMYATVGDLARFMIAMLAGGEGERGRVLGAETLERMRTPQLAAPGAESGFGIGFNVSRLDGRRRIGHGGAIYGFATELAMLPEAELGVVVTTTRDIANAVTTSLADYALRCALALQAGEPMPAYEPTPPLYADLAARIAGRPAPAATPAAEPSPPPAAPAAFPADQPPPPPAAELVGLLGEYGWDHDVLFILEREGRLEALIEWFFLYPLERIGADRYRFPAAGLYDGEQLVFERDPDGTATAAILGMPPDGGGAAPGGGAAGVGRSGAGVGRSGAGVGRSGAGVGGTAADWGVRFPRRAIGTAEGETFRIEPLRAVADLRAEALAASPPVEEEPEGGFLDADLVEVVELDPTILLDIRYATTNNFMGEVFYDEPRAFLQRPAAEALVRVNATLRAAGYGVLIHDAYRPWHVTKMFWDATPEAQRAFVADPAGGSRHNRGCAVDLTLYDLATGAPVQMVSGYDEFTERAYPDYPGGAGRQRWLRELLRASMEAEGFDVYEFEWWHFDYRDWRRYRILNLTFDEVR